MAHGIPELTMPAHNAGAFDATALLWHRSFPPMFRNGQQHDSEELFRDLLNALMEHRPKGPSLSRLVSLSSPLRSRGFLEPVGGGHRVPFQGTEASCVRCRHCGTVSSGGVRYADFLNLNLAIPPVNKASVSLDDCLRYYTRPEVVEDFICEYCSRRSSAPDDVELRDVEKRTLLGRFPDALCLHLQIASAFYVGDGFAPVKVDTHVRFPERLDMSPYHVSSHPDFFGTTSSAEMSRASASAASASPSSRASLSGRTASGNKLATPSPSAVRVLGGASATTPALPHVIPRTASPGAVKQVPYNLRAVIVHHGAGVGAGHFTSFRRLLRDRRGDYCPSADALEQQDVARRIFQEASGVSPSSDVQGSYERFVDSVDVRSRHDDVWVAVSDKLVMEVPKEHVLSSHAYLLFYEKEADRV